MKLLNAIVHEVIGLFVDDGLLALGILIVVALAALSELLMADTQITGGAILLFGCLGMLLVNVLRAGRD
jgi:hypothetical protein